MRKRRLLENVLLVAGLVAINIWIWSHALPVLIERLDEREFERSESGTPPTGRAPSGGAVQKRASGSRVGRLMIPRLRLRTMVREGTGETVLTLAAGHIPDTALPGEPGNVGVAGHRDTLFRGLKDIHRNDLILFETPGGKYRYRVESTEIVKPDEVSVLRPGRFPQLTLVTCYPFHYIGSAPQRFIVKARQVEAPRVEAASAAAVRPATRERPRVKPRAAVGSRTRATRPKPRRLELAAISRPDRRTR
jgi:sortase A